MDDRRFTLPDVWHGGFYELALEVGTRLDEHLLAILQAVWTHPSLEGCYLHRAAEPLEQDKVHPDIRHIESGFYLYGLATMRNGVRIPCGTVAIREDSGIDWLNLYLPMGALGTAYDIGGFPFDENKEYENWRNDVELWLHDIAQFVYKRSHFRLGLIGIEVSGSNYSEEIAIKGIPSKRDIGFLWETEDSLKYYPRNMN